LLELFELQFVLGGHKLKELLLGDNWAVFMTRF
jgi:hypothetical protein